MLNFLNIEDLIEQLTRDAAFYLVEHQDKSYTDWMAENKSVLGKLVKHERFPNDLIGRITSEAVMAAQFMLMYREIGQLEATIAELNELPTSAPEIEALNNRLAELQVEEQHFEALFKLYFQLFNYIVDDNIVQLIVNGDIYYTGTTQTDLTTDFTVSESTFFDMNPLFYPDEEQQQFGLSQAEIVAKFNELLIHTQRTKTLP